MRQGAGGEERVLKSAECCGDKPSAAGILQSNRFMDCILPPAKLIFRSGSLV